MYVFRSCVVVTFQNLGGNISVSMFAPESSGVDLNLLVIWLLAVVTVIIGSVWSGLIKYHMWVIYLFIYYAIWQQYVHIEKVQNLGRTFRYIKM